MTNLFRNVLEKSPNDEHFLSISLFEFTAFDASYSIANCQTRNRRGKDSWYEKCFFKTKQQQKKIIATSEKVLITWIYIRHSICSRILDSFHLFWCLHRCLVAMIVMAAVMVTTTMTTTSAWIDRLQFVYLALVLSKTCTDRKQFYRCQSDLCRRKYFVDRYLICRTNRPIAAAINFAVVVVIAPNRWLTFAPFYWHLP